MEWLKGRGRAHRTYEEAVRWVDAIKHSRSRDSQFMEWATRSPAHIEAFFEAWTTWDDLEALSREQRERIERLAQAAAAASATACRVVWFPGLAPSDRSARFVTSTRVLRLLVVCILAIAILMGIVRYRAPVTYETGADETRVVTLQDDSQLHLNSRTSLQVILRADRRDIELLRGEALFDVAHDVSRPFRVHHRGVIVQALGTQFDVRLYPHNLTVTVAAGRVAVWQPAQLPDPSRLDITAGQRVSVALDASAHSGKTQTLTARQLRGALGWSEGSLEMRGQRLSDVVEVFNHANTSRIVINDPRVAEIRMGGRFNVKDPESFVAALHGQHVVAKTEGTGEAIEWHLFRARTTAQPEFRTASSPPIESAQ